MARARNIKPGLFKNEVLGTQDPYITLLFVGLWTLADKSGILEDRPLRIKAELFPYREGFDINGYLTVLQRDGFIHRYEHGGVKLLQIAKFKEHQNPHHTEKDSIYPDYSTVCELSVKQPLNNGITPADSLNTDSLNTDSLITDSSVDGAENSAPKKTNGSALSKDWVLPKVWGEWALVERPEMTADQIRKEAEKFKDHWLANANQAKAKKSDWEATWRNWIRNAKVAVIKPAPDKEIYRQSSTEEAKAKLFGTQQEKDITHDAA